MNPLIPLLAVLALGGGGQSSTNPSPRLPSLRALTTPPAHLPAVEAALAHCLGRAGDGVRSTAPSGFGRSEARAGVWLYPATRGAALRVSLTEDATGCSLVVHEWPGATEPIAAWLGARGYRVGAQPSVFERTLSAGRVVQVGIMRGAGRSLLIFVGARPPRPQP